MMINNDKYELNCDKISYLEYQIFKEDDKLINKIWEISTPKNKKELESFLGLTNFYGKYLPRYSDIVEPFVELRKNNVKFKWTQRKNIAFESFKKVLIRKPIVKIFDPKKKVTLMTDGSEHAVAVILSQEVIQLFTFQVNWHQLRPTIEILIKRHRFGAQNELEISCWEKDLCWSQTTDLWNLYLTPEGNYQKLHCQEF